jgi:uncharacterized membrane protein YgdD (TMEM256/DUF423 family)
MPDRILKKVKNMHALQSPPAPTSTLLRLAVVASGLAGAAGVALLAMSAHVDPSGLLKTAAQILLFHAPVFLALGILGQVRRVPVVVLAFAVMAAGVTLFSGDLIARVFIDSRLFPMAAPTGGSLMIAGWIALALSAIRVRPE